ncbi:MAG: bacillithiol system redox-active protein YtxJ [Bacteroidota bacterium]|nr:bacillithiol system redox-active protein YtxJ [Bacteroidota bacterium]
MQFTPLTNEDQLNALAAAKDYQVILKHSTTCPISKGVYQRLQKEGDTITKVSAIHVVELQTADSLSKTIAGRFGVPHQSPQLLLIKDGKCAYHEWGFDISAEEVSKFIDGQ